MAISLLILAGLVLIYLELIFVPGTTFLGLVGLVLTGIGIYLTYENHGATTGNWVLAGSLLLSVVALVFSFKSNAWSRFSLKGINQSRVNEGYAADLQLEMRGTALSDLKPFGKAEFGNKTYEVTSAGHLIDSGSIVKIIHLSKNKIIVETINS